MRRAWKVDDNQGEIVKALERAGATVQLLSAVGHGCPDLLVGFRRGNFLLEVKDGRKPKSRRKLTPDQVKFFAWWKGSVQVVEDVNQALEEIGSPLRIATKA